MRYIAILDDDPLINEYLQQICWEFYTQEKVVVDSYLSGKDFLVANKQYDILFLDMMIGEENGLDVAEILRKTDKEVKLFVISGNDSYKQYAYNVHCFDFIDKPFDKQRIFEALEEVEAYGVRAHEEKNMIIIESVRNEKIVGLIDDICYIEYKERQVHVHTVRGVYQTTESLKELSERIKDACFVQCHRAFLINVKYVSKVISGKDIQMNNGDIVPLARPRRKEVLQAIEEYALISGKK